MKQSDRLLAPIKEHLSLLYALYYLRLKTHFLMSPTRVDWQRDRESRFRPILDH